MRAQKPDWQKRIAEERIQILFSQARQQFKKHPERSRRYVQLARKIGLRYNIRLDNKRQFCRNCNTLLAGSSSQTRLDKSTRTLAIKCLKCNSIYRYPYK